MSTKLPESRDAAMTMPFTSPTGYGLGRGGWVTSAFEPGDDPPVDILCDWIEESYRAVAPKKLVAELDSRRGESALTHPDRSCPRWRPPSARIADTNAGGGSRRGAGAEDGDESLEEGVDELVGVEGDQVADGLAQADELDRDAEVASGWRRRCHPWPSRRAW